MSACWATIATIGFLLIVIAVGVGDRGNVEGPRWVVEGDPGCLLEQQAPRGRA